MRQESGTEAQRLAYDTTSANPAGALPVLSTWEVTSGAGQGNKFTWGGSAWVQTHLSGAAHVAAQHRRTVTYTDGTYNFYCDAPHGSLLTAAVWHIERFTIATNATVHAYNQVATDSGTVAALAATVYNGGDLS